VLNSSFANISVKQLTDEESLEILGATAQINPLSGAVN
jgi:hypothetical protein